MNERFIQEEYPLITYVSMLPEAMPYPCSYSGDLPQLCAENIRFPVTAMVRGFARNPIFCGKTAKNA